MTFADSYFHCLFFVLWPCKNNKPLIRIPSRESLNRYEACLNDSSDRIGFRGSQNESLID